MELTLFVMSDLHAFDSGHSGDRRPSFFDTAQLAASGDNPIEDLKALLRSDASIRAQYLIFCGDLADQAYPPATERAWRELQDISQLLDANRILTTVGNHDLDSRHGFNDHRHDPVAGRRTAAGAAQGRYCAAGDFGRMSRVKNSRLEKETI